MTPDPEDPASAAEIEALTEAACRGDRAAIDRLVERYLPNLRAFVRLRTGPLIRRHETGSDLVQSVCREVIEHMDRFQYPSESAFKQWLFTTALRKISRRRDYYLAQRRDALREQPLQGGDTDSTSGSARHEAELVQQYRSFSTPSKRMILREEVERIEVAFGELPDEYREVITLAHVVGLSRREIAEQMDRSEGAIRVLLHRALARVSSLLGESKDD